jgi:hypothetical protein
MSYIQLVSNNCLFRGRVLLLLLLLLLLVNSNSHIIASLSAKRPSTKQKITTQIIQINTHKHTSQQTDL